MRSRTTARRKGRTAPSAASSAPAATRREWPRSRDTSRSPTGTAARSWWTGRSNHAPRDLVRLDRLEQRAEIALAEALVALPLDDLEEDRADHVRGEDLQQLVLVVILVHALAVQQDAVLLHALEVLAVVLHARVDALVVRVGRVEELHLARAQHLDGREDVLGRERDVLDALAVIGVEVFLDLRLGVRRLVDRNADLSA